VVHGRVRAEGRGARMTRRAILAGGDVVGGLADDAARAGVAAGAARGDAGVIEACSREAHKARVTADAISRRCNVVGGFGDGRDTGEGLPVVTGGAARGDTRVVHGRVRAEGCRARMTRRAILRGRDVVGGLADDTACAGVAAGAA